MYRTSWLSYQRLLDMPVLVALNAADTATSIAELTDEQAVAEAMEVREGDTAQLDSRAPRGHPPPKRP